MLAFNVMLKKYNYSFCGELHTDVSPFEAHVVAGQAPVVLMLASGPQQQLSGNLKKTRYFRRHLGSLHLIKRSGLSKGLTPVPGHGQPTEAGWLEGQAPVSWENSSNHQAGGHHPIFIFWKKQII